MAEIRTLMDVTIKVKATEAAVLQLGIALEGARAKHLVAVEKSDSMQAYAAAHPLTDVGEKARSPFKYQSRDSALDGARTEVLGLQASIDQLVAQFVDALALAFPLAHPMLVNKLSRAAG